MWVIEWRREPRRILVPVLILAHFPTTNLAGVAARALLDTGSSVSGVTPRVADALGLVRLGKRPLTSAQGEGRVERYAFRVGLRVDAASEGGPAFPFVFDEVIGIELPNAFEFEALLGMDLLGLCDFAMSRRGQCRLSFG
jgi:hypothetical protein